MPQSTPLVRRDLLAIACVLGLSIGVAFALATRPAAGDGGLTGSVPDITMPSVDLLPGDVVRLQLQSMRDSEQVPDALVQCYVLASPANLSFTGPFDRFAQMIDNPDYHALKTSASSLIGEPVINGDYATVLVTAMDDSAAGNGAGVSVYRFWLSRQTQSPQQGCWMTDAVLLDQQMKRPRPPKPAPSTVFADPKAGVRETTAQRTIFASPTRR